MFSTSSSDRNGCKFGSVEIPGHEIHRIRSAICITRSQKFERDRKLARNVNNLFDGANLHVAHEYSEEVINAVPLKWPQRPCRVAIMCICSESGKQHAPLVWNVQRMLRTHFVGKAGGKILKSGNIVLALLSGNSSADGVNCGGQSVLSEPHMIYSVAFSLDLFYDSGAIFFLVAIQIMCDWSADGGDSSVVRVGWFHMAAISPSQVSPAYSEFQLAPGQLTPTVDEAFAHLKHMTLALEATGVSYDRFELAELFNKAEPLWMCCFQLQYLPEFVDGFAPRFMDVSVRGDIGIHCIWCPAIDLSRALNRPKRRDRKVVHGWGELADAAGHGEDAADHPPHGLSPAMCLDIGGELELEESHADADAVDVGVGGPGDDGVGDIIPLPAVDEAEIVLKKIGRKRATVLTCKRFGKYSISVVAEADTDRKLFVSICGKYSHNSRIDGILQCCSRERDTVKTRWKGSGRPLGALAAWLRLADEADSAHSHIHCSRRHMRNE